MITLIRDTLNIDYILRQFENLFNIDPNTPDLKQQIITSRAVLEQRIKIAIPEDGIYFLRGYDQVDILLGALTDCLKNIALLVNIESYDSVFGQTLKDINYLGTTETKLINSFKILSKKDLQVRRIEFFNELLTAFSAIKVCSLRRMVCIIGVLENIGVLDGVAILANHIVIGAMYK